MSLRRFAMDLILRRGISSCSGERLLECLETARSRGCEGIPSENVVFEDAEAWAPRRNFWRETVGEWASGVKDDIFDVADFVGHLKTRLHGNCVLFSHCLESTQTVVFEAGDLPSGTVCVADIQTKGRGRGSNVWTSPPGCLLFSFSTKVRDVKTLPLVQYLACLAVVRGIKELPGMEQVDVRIKWPNDIYVNRAIKIGGILCQSVIRGNDFTVTIGIGLNVNNAEPTTCLNQLGSLHVSREHVLASILNQYEVLHEEFEDPSRGFSPRIKEEYEQTWLHSGQLVTLDQEGGTQATIQGIKPEAGGCLLARAVNDGTLYELYPDGNRLDFFKGLVSKKVA